MWKLRYSLWKYRLAIVVAPSFSYMSSEGGPEALVNLWSKRLRGAMPLVFGVMKC
jgi:hypothetical protein